MDITSRYLDLCSRKVYSCLNETDVPDRTYSTFENAAKLYMNVNHVTDPAKLLHEYSRFLVGPWYTKAGEQKVFAALVETAKRLPNDHLKELTDLVKISTVAGRDTLLNVCEYTLESDRILSNVAIMNKRFNMTKFVTRCANCRTSLEETTRGLCEFVDTYNIPVGKKFVYAVESFHYILKSAGFNDGVIDENALYSTITDFFLTESSIINDKNMGIMRWAAEEYGITESTEPYFRNNDGNTFTTIITSLTEATIQAKGSDENKSMIFMYQVIGEMIKKQNVLESLSEEAFEKEKHAYVSENADMKFMHESMNAICGIPLAIGVRRECVYGQTLNAIKTVKLNPRMRSFIETQLKDQLCGKYNDMAICNIEEYYDRYIFSAKSAKMMLEDGTASYNIDDFIKQYKAEQNKDAGSFKRFITRLYSRPPGVIVGGLSRVLSLVRGVFVLSTVAVPVVGPVLSGLTLLADRLIEMKITSDQCKDAIEAFRAEKKTVKGKLDDLDGEEKDKAEKYIKSLDDYIEKFCTYRNSLDDENPTDDDDDGGFDFNWESADEDMIEESKKIVKIMTYMEALNLTLSLPDILDRNIDFVANNAKTVSEMVQCCKNSISYDDYINIIRRHSSGKLGYTVTESAAQFVGRREPAVDMSGTLFEQVLIEAEIIKALQEGVKLSDLKLSWKAVKDKIRNLSSKEKALCQQLDAAGARLFNSLEKSKVDRRAAIIKGELIPSLSGLIKKGLLAGAVAYMNPVAGLITAVGMFASSAILDTKEKIAILDEINTELKVVELAIEKAKNEDNMDKYRFALNTQKKLKREQKRISLGLKGKVEIIPM